MKTHNENTHTSLNFKCRTCSQSFSSKNKLEEHIVTHVLRCQDCQFHTTVDSELNKHRRIHQFKCQKCSYHAIHQKDLNRHCYTMHPTCNICDYRAKNGPDLQDHQKSHTDMTFSCNICGKQNSSEDELKTHIITTHQPKQRTRIFSRRNSTSSSDHLSNKRTTGGIFRPWSPSSTPDLNPKPFTSLTTDIPEGFLRAQNNNLNQK